MASSEEINPVNNDIPDKIMVEVSAFPSMPRAGFKLRALLNREDVELTEIEEILRHDPGLATNVLRLANSAFFGLSQKVGSLKQAVMLLGVKRFAQIAVSASMSKTMEKAVEGYYLSPGELWHHSIAVSNTAEALAKNRKIDSTDDVFTPALVHDMGKLVLDKFVKKDLQKIENLTSNAVPLEVAEHMVLGTDHAEIGALILARWSFPIDIVNAVRWHHNPENIKSSKINSDIVYLSNQICQSNTGTASDSGQNAAPSSVVLKRLGIKLDQYKAMAEKTHRWMKKLSYALAFE
ncbi:MAG: HDOD domain-containing protein [Desulfobacterales bacterium]|jgi:putative nucleotidyltransferase with HDIG domain